MKKIPKVELYQCPMCFRTAWAEPGLSIHCCCNYMASPEEVPDILAAREMERIEQEKREKAWRAERKAELAKNRAIRNEGRTAAERGLPRVSPHSVPSKPNALWLAGYDAVAKECR